jgi:hypothetical protein
MTYFTFIFCTILDIFNDDLLLLLDEELTVQNRPYCDTNFFRSLAFV